MQDAQVEASKLGVGVTPAGQQLFDTLSKTLPCRWRGTSIVVLNEVRLFTSQRAAHHTAVMLRDMVKLTSLLCCTEADSLTWPSAYVKAERCCAGRGAGAVWP